MNVEITKIGKSGTDSRPVHNKKTKKFGPCLEKLWLGLGPTGRSNYCSTKA